MKRYPFTLRISAAPRTATAVALAAVAAFTAVALSAATAPQAAVASAGATSGNLGGTPNFGPNVKIFYPGTPAATINAYLKSISTTGQFGNARHAVYFMPGTYGSASGGSSSVIDSTVGYYTSIAGLGSSPTDVRINGSLHVEPVASAFGKNSLVNFWRSLSNVTIDPIQPATKGASGSGDAAHTMRWSVSQASPLRRVNILGNLDLNGSGGSIGFGSELANSRVTGTVIAGNGASGTDNMRQWLTTDSTIGRWSGTGVNYVFAGVKGAPTSSFASSGVTGLSTTSDSRQAPFLMLKNGKFDVFVPSATTGTVGYDWSSGRQAGRTIPISRFFIAQPTDTAQEINSALAGGHDLILTPGVYHLDKPIAVNRPDTVIMGLGYATVTPTNGTPAIEVGNVADTVISDVIVDAGKVRSTVLVQVGSGDSHAGRASDPSLLSDLFVRIGGATPGSTATAVVVNSSHVIIDDAWIWRADHGNGVGWTANTAVHGLIVNGSHVTAYGLSVEHFQREQLIWNGKDGTTVSFQSEFPYDPPSQAAWMDGSSDGYPAYVATSSATGLQATGLVVYAVNWRTVALHAARAVRAPVTPSIRFRSLTTGVIIGLGGVEHIIDNAGAAVDASKPNNLFGEEALARLGSFPAYAATSTTPTSSSSRSETPPPGPRR